LLQASSEVVKGAVTNIGAGWVDETLAQVGSYDKSIWMTKVYGLGFSGVSGAASQMTPVITTVLRCGLNWEHIMVIWV
jgi:hypothetical protein